MGLTPAPAAPALLLTYAVWLPGRGWLALTVAGQRPRVFMDPRREVAESAAALWGPGAVVLPADESLVDLQEIFLRQEKERLAKRQAKSVKVRFKAWVVKHGLHR